ncbi:hypothetical protein KAT63_05460 [Candidatus Parcubacteria bacterium]|nr:hypothetical protein [Candidatus Parcubacteria bacterium]
MNKKILFGLKVLAVAIIIVALLVGLNNLKITADTNRKEIKANLLNADEINATVSIVGNGSESGLLKIRVIIDNSENKMSEAKILSIRYLYPGKTKYLEWDMKVDQDKRQFCKDFELPKNEIYSIKITVRNKYDGVQKDIHLNTW